MVSRAADFARNESSIFLLVGSTVTRRRSGHPGLAYMRTSSSSLLVWVTTHATLTFATLPLLMATELAIFARNELGVRACFKQRAYQR